MDTEGTGACVAPDKILMQFKINDTFRSKNIMYWGLYFQIQITDNSQNTYIMTQEPYARFYTTEQDLSGFAYDEVKDDGQSFNFTGSIAAMMIFTEEYLTFDWYWQPMDLTMMNTLSILQAPIYIVLEFGFDRIAGTGVEYSLYGKGNALLNQPRLFFSYESLNPNYFYVDGKTLEARGI